MRKVFVAVLFTMAIMACTKKENADILLGDNKIYAIIQKFDNSDTKAQLNNKMNAVWNGGDTIRTFVPGKTSDYKFDGKTGDRAGSFTWSSNHSACEGLDSGAFAIYPIESYLGYDTKNNFMLSVNLKDIQRYRKDSFDEDVNIMVGKSSDGVNYSFKNILGYLRMTLTGDKRVRSITISGNGFEDTAGDLSFFANKPSYLFWNPSGEIYSETTLDCGDDGVLLTADEPTHFYIAFPPMNFAEGLTATIKYTDGFIYPHSTTKRVEIKQNQIFPMETINTSSTQWQIAKIFNSTTTIETPIISALSGVTSLSGVIDYGDGNVITLSDLTDTHKYTDGKESHIITVQVKDANSITLNSCKGVSKIDFSNF